MARLAVSSDDRAAPFTDRELTVLERIARGEPINSIATAMGIADQTVRNHLKNVASKITLIADS